MDEQPKGSLFQVGDLVRYVGRVTIRDGEGSVLLEADMVGKITEATKGWAEKNGPIHEGYNRIVFCNGYSRTILPHHASAFKVINLTAHHGEHRRRSGFLA